MHHRRNVEKLFNQGELRSVVIAHETALRDALKRIPDETIRVCDTEVLVQNLVAEHSIEMIVLYEDAVERTEPRSLEPAPDGFGVPGSGGCYEVTYYVPFSGSEELFRVRGSTLVSLRPEGRIEGKQLAIPIVGTNDPSEFESGLRRQLSLVRQWLSGIAPDVAGYNGRIPHSTRSEINARKSQIAERDKLAGTLRYPIRKDATPAFQVPVKRKPLSLDTSTMAQASSPDSYVLLDGGDYFAILNTMHDMSMVLERSPGFFSAAE